MDLIVAMLVINGLVAVVAVIIAVAQQRFHKRVEAKLSEAIANTHIQISDRIDDVQKGIDNNVIGLQCDIDKRIDDLEKEFYVKLEDPNTYKGLIKAVGDNIHSRWMAQAKAIDKKIVNLKQEAQQMMDDPLATITWDEDKGILGNLMANPMAVRSIIQPGPKPEEAMLSPSPVTESSGNGPPSWWSEEDQKAMEEFVASRSPNGVT